MQEYTSFVPQTNSPTDQLDSESQNDLPGSQAGYSMVRRVCIPGELMQEIDAADLHGIVKVIVYWIIYRCLTTRAKCQAINQALLDTSLNSDRRKELMRFLNASKYIRPASGGLYRPGRQAKRYELHSLQILSESEYQHNNEMVCKLWGWGSVLCGWGSDVADC